MALDLNKLKVVDKFLNEGKLPEFEISIAPGTIAGLGFMGFVVGASLYMFFKMFGK